MNYQEFLDAETKKPEGGALFLAKKTKNIFGIDSLVEREFVPAIIARLEIAAERQDQDKIIELKAKAITLTPQELRGESVDFLNQLIDEKTPKDIIKRDKNFSHKMLFHV